MSKTLEEIALELNTPKKVSGRKKQKVEFLPIPRVQLIYAFNGSGKTRLSRTFKDLIAPKSEGVENNELTAQTEGSGIKILYYNALVGEI